MLFPKFIKIFIRNSFIIRISSNTCSRKRRMSSNKYK